MKPTLLALTFVFGLARSVSGATPTVVQRFAGSGSEGQLITAYPIRLPNKVLSGNAVYVMVGQYSGPQPTIADDQSNSYTMQQSQAGTHLTLYLFSKNNITNTPQTLTVSWASNAAPDMIAAGEFRNIETGASYTDGTSGNTGTNGTTMTTGSLATAQDGDLILSFASMDLTSGAQSVASEMTSWTPQSGVSLLHADLARYHAGAYQIQTTHTTASLNVATESGDATNGWVTVTVAFKSLAAGTAPSAGIHIDGTIHMNVSAAWTASTAKQQVANTGNLLVACFATEPLGTAGVTAVSDTVGSTWFDPTGAVGPSSGTSVTANQWYSKGLSVSQSRVITWTYGGNVSGGEPFYLYDISGADASAPVDKTGTDWGTDALTTGLVDESSASTETPTSQNGNGTALGAPSGTGELMIQGGAIFDNSVATGVTAFTGASPGFIQTSSDTTPDIGSTPIDESDITAVYALPNANNPGNTTWSKKQAHAVGDWADISRLYKAAATVAGGNFRTLMGVGK